jgi:hypothetical protein
MSDPQFMTISRDAWLRIVKANRDNANKGDPSAVRWVIEHDAPAAMYLHSVRNARPKTRFATSERAHLYIRPSGNSD